MSRVGKMPIAVPQGIDVAISAESITVKGKELDETEVIGALNRGGFYGKVKREEKKKK